MGFTDNQLKAITASKTDILVSAAAGSGKTTVLVERIIRRILDKDNPIDIDRMLVLTFTKAAASSMREKILEAIEKKRNEDPSNAHIAKQAMLIQNAQISTFHGFCQEIIRNHFYEIDADPMLRVMDEAEGKLMKIDALSRVLERAYENADDDFFEVIESYATGKNDKAIEDLILKIYELSQSHPNPGEWLEICKSSYDVDSKEELKNAKWFRLMYESLKNSANSAKAVALRLISVCDEPGGPSKYRPMAEDDGNFAQALIDSKDIEEFISISRVHERQGLARITAKDCVDGDLKEKFKSDREVFYKIIGDINKTFARSLDDEIALMKKLSPLAKVVIGLVSDFSAEFKSAKEDAGVLDFNDMEHLAIEILKNNKGVTADEYREHFVEIYVDEYQDSNLTQEELITLIGRGNAGQPGNVFMVGDVKQSIYRFRMARPDLFLGKYNSFAHEYEPGKGLRIDLSDNFRSRREVLNCTNEIFEQIMNAGLGGIEYDEAASLHYGNVYDNVSGGDFYKSELILAVKDETLSVSETEAYAIANKINEIVGVNEIKDSKTGLMRKIRYSDIVILLRSMTGKDSVYRRVLLENGIPSYVTTGVGYFSSKEIETILSYLAVIDNPLQDIPLAASMRSFFGGFSDADMAMIRVLVKDKYLYTSLKKIADPEFSLPDSAAYLKEKTAEFLRTINELRDKAEYMSVYEILKELIDGEYGDYVRSGIKGFQAGANLNMLLKKALDFGRQSYKGLFHFLRYIEQLRKYEVDYGEAGITDENDTNVRIMTIHKSKGLEFPVVFVSGLSKKRNTNDEWNEVLADADFGMGLNFVDTALRLKKSTLLRQFILNRIKSENIAEEIRVLYVALTRAQEKLYLISAVKDLEKDFYNNDKLLEKCSSYTDFIAHAYNKKGSLDHLSISETGSEDFVILAMKKNMSLPAIYNEISEKMKSGRENVPDYITDVLDFVYPYEKDTVEYSKVSVSELKKASMQETFEDDGYEPYVPDFVREEAQENNAGSFYGTAFHRMLELWDYSISSGREDEVSETEISEYFDKMLNLGKIDAIQLDAVKSSEILSFLKTDIARRMGKASSKGKLFREQPFLIGVEPNMMMVQGIIDAYWIEDDGIVILDYKTDRVRSGQTLIDRYHVQLEYYEMALNRLLNIPVKGKVIYASRLREVVELTN